jgi:choline kinase
VLSVLVKTSRWRHFYTGLVLVQSAVILAAGRGIRLGRLGTEQPKGFIEIGGQPLIVRSINHLLASGIERIVIVTGHMANVYDQLAEKYGGRLECCFNPNFASSGSFESLCTSLTLVHEPFLLLESDIIYQPVALKTVMSHKQESVLLASGPTGAGDEVYVWSEFRPESASPVLTDLSKNLETRPEKPFGELVGIVKIGHALRGLLEDKAAELRISHPRSDYEAGLVAVSACASIACCKLADLVWAEIDDERMLDHVRTNVYPRMQRAGAT